MCTKALYKYLYVTHFVNLTKRSFYNFLTTTLFETFLKFNGKFYELCYCVAMDFPLEPTLVNVLRATLKTFGLKTALLISSYFLQTIRWWYIFTLSNKEWCGKPQKYLTKHHKKIKFRLCINSEKFHWEIETLKSSWINVLESFWINYLSKNTFNWRISKRELHFVLPYLAKILLYFRTR